MSEFDIIKTYFDWQQKDPSVSVNVGDDAAVMKLEANEELVVSVDTSISGVHFPDDTPAHAIGYKSLAVNLSDLAAMGATPRWFTLALTLPDNNAQWLAEFSNSMRELADAHQVTLTGGDTTRGPLSITIQIMGTVPQGQALLRSGANIGDLICVTGTLGDAAAGLACHQNTLNLPTEDSVHCLSRLNYPSPRVAFGKSLRTHANSCIDISDGLLADLQHILDKSDKAAELTHSSLPFSEALNRLSTDKKIPLALTGGDDYELLFTLASEKLDKIKPAATKTNTDITVIGKVVDKAHSQPKHPQTMSGLQESRQRQGFDHFGDKP